MGCPALSITDLSRACYEIHALSHSVQPGTFVRHISYADLIELPCIVSEAFDIIADEAHGILKESHGSSPTGDGGRNQAE
jgi:hypothetical protein